MSNRTHCLEMPCGNSHFLW